MTVEVQHYSQARCLFTVPRSEFTPVPKVNGVVVEFAMHKPAERAVADSAAFITMVRTLCSLRLHMDLIVPVGYKFKVDQRCSIWFSCPTIL